MASKERADWARGGAGIELLEAAFEKFMYDRHTHDTYAIGVTLRGVQRFSCRNATHDSTPGQVMVINPGEVHDGRSGTAGGYMYRMFYVQPDILATALEDVTRRPSDVGARRPVISDRDLFRQLDLAWRTMVRAPASLAAEELLHRSLASLGASVVPARSASATRFDRTLRSVRDYMHDHVEQRVTLQELSAIATMSRFQLTRRFQEAYGLPLHAYHLHARLEEGRRRLASGQTIAAVSADLGFVDQSHFHRRFKGSFGMTPGAWRAAHGHRTRRTSSSISK